MVLPPVGCRAGQSPAVEKEQLPAPGYVALEDESPVLITEPSARLPLYSERRRSPSVEVAYDGVIREASDNPRYFRRGFWPGAARHYCAQGPSNDALLISHLPGPAIKPSAGEGARLDPMPGAAIAQRRRYPQSAGVQPLNTCRLWITGAWLAGSFLARSRSYPPYQRLILWITRVCTL